MRRIRFHSWPVRLMAIGGVLALIELALYEWQGVSYWGFSSGVYTLSAREFLHGLVPYHDFAVAQPPPVFLVGAALLALSDSLAAVQAGLSVLSLITAGLVSWCVWRLEGSWWLALVAGAASPLLPISLASHAQLLPENLAAPLLLGGAILVAERPRQPVGCVLLALAALCKLAFVLPALAVALAVPGRRRAVGWLIGAFAAMIAASLVAFGTSMWRETVLAQLQVGSAQFQYAAGLLAQAGWNQLPLLAGAAGFVVVALREPARLRDRCLARTLTAAALGGMVLAASVLKRGSYINVLSIADPALMVMATCGSAWAWRRWRWARPAVSVLVAFLVAQSASLLLAPGSPTVARRPFAASGLSWTASAPAVRRLVATARRCPARLAYSGSPYVAFLAGRRPPGEQPDEFIIEHARADARFAVQATRDRPTCP